MGPAGGQAFWLRAKDGIRLRMGIWPAPDQAKGTVFLLPGRTEYVEKYGPSARAFAQRGYAMLAVDWRGQGLADRLIPDPVKGHVVNFLDYQLDLDAVIAQAQALNLPKPWVVLGHSMGAAIALRHLVTQSLFSACAFSGPMFGVEVPPILRPVRSLIALVLQKCGPVLFYPPGMTHTPYVMRVPFTGNRLTKDREMWEWMQDHLRQEPGLALAGPSFHWVAEAILECDRLAKMPSPNLPCYCAVGTDERIIDIPRVDDRMAHWPGAIYAHPKLAEHEVMMDNTVLRDAFYDGCTAVFDTVCQPEL
ncbi:hypothetical protein BFP70_13405 [Thioclava sp. SK-1]|nr:hypothetical protein BFP70_13405 [Thioclava sp. SK-1]